MKPSKAYMKPATPKSIWGQYLWIIKSSYTNLAPTKTMSMIAKQNPSHRKFSILKEPIEKF